MKLLMDIGNRRLKWATATATGLAECSGVLGYEDADDSGLAALAAQLGSLDRPQAVWACCVAHPEIRRAVVEYAHGTWSLQPVFITAQKQQAGIVNGYSDAASLGGDRWAALVAARDLFPRQAVIVVDAGTAVTVDLLDDGGTFHGGVIFPGVYAMRSALGAQTQNIAENIAENIANDTTCDDPADSTAPPNAIATDTKEAVASGTLLAVAGGINLAITRQLAALPGGTSCQLIATGGDAERIAPLLETAPGIKPNIVPQLVLHGLAVIAREAAS